ncbi:winged helix-turn-helix domain-containing protein [Streptomyces jumonjinensis]|uniref:Winged helix family transcriptional regulator n=1 Tax=Streptomyces jumonjinensis TaxID=1945 RepID=A0A646KIM1_STRJU|nr:winged helix-turn-helix domain-containing protein [Streptomyces jumonjinensis]MQT01920.1 winged helix family transcriptional regulator [Streptomyces jumonjinensis]
MANSLPFSAVSTVSAVSAVPGGSAAARPAAGVSTARRLRAVERDEVVPPVRLAQVAELLPPGATWLPAPQHTVPSLPGRPPMVGYLVLVPADQHPPAAVGGTGPVRIDQAERIAVVNGRALDLTYLEFELLTHLVTHPHRVHTRDQLVTTVWGYGHVGDGRTVDVHVARLRRKLGAEHRHTIQTVRRVGYKYTP